MFKIKPSSLAALRSIKNEFLDQTKMPEEKKLNTLKDDDVWIRIVSQVVVVGGAKPAELLKDKEVKAKISWENLKSLTEGNRKRVIWEVLKQIKARYAGKSIESCKKTDAIFKNFEIIKSEYGPKSFLLNASKQPGDKEKIKYISKLSYFKNKGARDFLTSGFGVLKNSIAIDSRVMNSLNHVGIELPSEVLKSTKKYEAAERQLIEEVCKPLDLLGSELDQLLFKNYEKIITQSW
ncbi:hypothetical protein AAEU28_11965 [Pseudoalteromonas sp. SS15]|uniref:hypothetical protein n=1 Tax=Pseudoalteromonas sp. SS15 TaxID=3139393 RepID=UPI003BAAEBFD